MLLKVRQMNDVVETGKAEIRLLGQKVYDLNIRLMSRRVSPRNSSGGDIEKIHRELSQSKIDEPSITEDFRAFSMIP